MFSEVVQGQVTAPAEVPESDHPAHRDQGVSADRWSEAHEMGPSRFFASRGRNVYPKNVKLVCSKAPGRRASWQSTIRVLAGCSCNPTSAIRAVRSARTRSAWPWLTQ